MDTAERGSLRASLVPFLHYPRSRVHMSRRGTHENADGVEHFYELGTPSWMSGGDQLLFHYTSAETALRHILPAGTLRMNPYGAMRDPLENKEIPFAVRFKTNRRPRSTCSMHRQPFATCEARCACSASLRMRPDTTLLIYGRSEEATRAHACGSSTEANTLASA